MALTDLLKKAVIATALLVPTISTAQGQTIPFSQSQETQYKEPTIPEIMENKDKTIKAYKLKKSWQYSTNPNQVTWSYSKEGGWCIIDKKGGVMGLERAIVRKSDGTIDRFVDFPNEPNKPHTAYYPVYKCGKCDEHHPDKRTSPSGLYKSKTGIVFGLRE